MVEWGSRSQSGGPNIVQINVYIEKKQLQAADKARSIDFAVQDTYTLPSSAFIS